MDPYYEEVGRYYDEDARDFLRRYEGNYVLQTLREDFRRQTLRHLRDRPKRILEIGFGPGLDMEFFASVFPDAEIWGVEVSRAMIDVARSRLGEDRFVYLHGSVEELDIREKFDLVYSYFGAFNTVKDLRRLSEALLRVSHRNTLLVFSCVNKPYLFDMLFYLLTLRPKRAFARLGRWGGYSSNKFLDSRPLSYSDILRSMEGWRVEYFRGYSILYPAWYRHHRYPPALSRMLWRIDGVLNLTPLKYVGEYALYVMRPEA